MIKRFEVEFLKEANELLQLIDERAKRKILHNIFKARYVLDVNLFKKLQGGVWEFRTFHLRKHYRFLAFWVKGQKISKVVITHGVIKKSNQLQHQEIEKTVKIMSDYLKGLE